MSEIDLSAFRESEERLLNAPVMWIGEAGPARVNGRFRSAHETDDRNVEEEPVAAELGHLE